MFYTSQLMCIFVYKYFLQDKYNISYQMIEVLCIFSLPDCFRVGAELTVYADPARPSLRTLVINQVNSGCFGRYPNVYICVNTYKKMLPIVTRIRNTKVQYFPLSCKNKNRRGLGGVFQIRKLYCNRKKVKINCNKQLFCINLVGVQLQ